MQNTDDSTVLLYKPRNLVDLDKYPHLTDDFLLVLMNNSQKQILKLYGSDVICVDFTHEVSAYSFDLTTIVILNNRECFPATFIISNSQDSLALSTAFQAIKEHCSNVSLKILMTDDAEAFYNA